MALFRIVCAASAENRAYVLYDNAIRQRADETRQSFWKERIPAETQVFLQHPAWQQYHCYRHL
jgi:hypothetical protein